MDDKQKPPDYLDAMAKACWLRLAPDLELTPAKQELLAYYCKSHSTYWKLESQMEHTDYLIPATTGKGLKGNPLASYIHQAFDRCIKAAKSLGISTIDQPLEAVDEVEEFAKKRKAS